MLGEQHKEPLLSPNPHFAARAGNQGVPQASSQKRSLGGSRGLPSPWVSAQFAASFDTRPGKLGGALLRAHVDMLRSLSRRAVDILRTASATSHMRLLIARDDDAR